MGIRLVARRRQPAFELRQFALSWSPATVCRRVDKTAPSARDGREPDLPRSGGAVMTGEDCQLPELRLPGHSASNRRHIRRLDQTEPRHLLANDLCYV